MKPFHLLHGLLIVLSISACQGKREKLASEALPITRSFTDASGRTISLAKTPERIISLAPNITEILFAIGSGDRVAARSQACNFPEEALLLPEITTYPQLDLEQIQAADADLILTTDEIFSADDIAQLGRLGIPVFVQSYRSLDDVYRSMRVLGELLENGPQANAAADSLARLEQAIAKATENQIRYGTLIVISNDPLKVVGGGSYMDELIRKAGGRNVFGDLKEAYPTTTVEEILSRQPEILIIPTPREQDYAQLIGMYPALDNTPAAASKQVYIIHPDLLYRPGPRMIQGLIELTHLIHNSLPLPVPAHAE